MRSAFFLLSLLLAACLLAPAQAGPLRIYGMENRPTSFMDGERPAGMAVDLVAEIQRRMGQAQPFEIIPWARANTLARGPDVMLAAVVRTPERAHLRFVGPIFTDRISAYAVRERLPELRMRDPGFTRLRAGGQRSTVFSSLPRRLGYNLTDEPNSAEAAAKMLMSGRFDLWFIADELVPDTLRKAGFAPDAVAPALHLSVEGVYFAFSPGTDERVVEAWTVALRQMKGDGSFLRIHRKWLKDHQLPPDVTP
ncbi:MAG: transporter substrate-binding domain-containing protein [Duganella sp.]